MNQEVLQRAKKIKLIIFDVDGVLTDGGLTLGDDGQEYKTFNTQDGLGMKLLSNSGVDLAIITGRTSNVVMQRAANTGVKHVFQGVENKLATYRELLSHLNLQPEETAFMGDDVVDMPPMLRCGLSITVPAAPEVVKKRAHYITGKEGGRGAVREACELIMKAQNTLEAQLAPYFDVHG